ncbi:cell envelope integrity protein CreD [Puia dinghuensis]|uniref:Cell envelope integrity protein CreD n=1 Tax=Puia dinghuensis TaxID=1792502 RepID=A0A8J2UH14_9BACT|nr:cell envelope integrity protein CreD [Puia dinghuensis]GGB14153.1 cell envelope integrity protein CreD [Puia dinghuensis]
MENKSNFWSSYRILFKSAIIGALILLLLIPTSLIQNLVAERQQRQQEAVAEIRSRWAAPQTICGPVIGIPYIDVVTDNGNRQEIKRWAYFLPGKLNIRSRLVPEKRYRGIYQVVVYTTELDLQGSFDSLHLDELNLSPDNMLWKEATVFFDISDVQGLKEDMILHLTTHAESAGLDLTPARRSTEQFKTALAASLPDWLQAAAGSNIEFSASIKLKGSGNLSFIPAGRETKVEAASSWPDPSFTGSALPDLRTVKDSGFVADWKILALNRKFPQQWKQGVYELGDAAFGVNLIIPVDAYQQTTRSVKYAILIILLTFTAFLLIEWVYDRNIHALQYTLVGLALCIFYTLLLSFSEYLGFNGAYTIAAIATIGLIAWYVGSLLRSSRMSLFVTFLLVVQYGFVFTLIQLQDYALLMGSIGLFITLAIVMYFSRKIKNLHPSTH